MIVTVDDLVGRSACAEQVATFMEVFGGKARVTRRNLLRAAEAGLDVGWFASEFLPVTLWVEYERQEALLWAEYKRQEALLWVEYERQEALLWAEYKRQEAPLLADVLGLK